MNVTKSIKNYIISELDMDFVGVADATLLAQEPEGHRPEDILPGAASIIVFGRSIADGVIESDFRYIEDKMSPAQSSYAAYGSDLAANFLLADNSFTLATYLEDMYGEIALPLPSNVQQGAVWDIVPGPLFTDPYAQGLPINVFQAAVAAGIGEYGWSNRIVTEEYGPRINLAAVLTTMKLDADEPYNGPRLCDPETCGICAKMCPTNALATPCEGCETTCKSIVGKTQEVGKLKVNSCLVASMAYRKEFQGRIPVPDQIMGNDPTDEELKAAFAAKPLNGLSVDHYPRYFCDRCLIYCPIGKWKERFFDTGLSKHNPDEERLCTAAR